MRLLQSPTRLTCARAGPADRSNPNNRINDVARSRLPMPWRLEVKHAADLEQPGLHDRLRRQPQGGATERVVLRQHGIAVQRIEHVQVDRRLVAREPHRLSKSEI